MVSLADGPRGPPGARPPGQHDEPAHLVLQLPDVPGRSTERRHDLGQHGQSRPAPRAARARRLSARDVVPTGAQRRQVAQDREPVEEVTEGAVRDHRLEVAVGRRDDPDVDLAHLVGAHLPDLALLQDPQQLLLHGRAHVPDLVQEQRAPVGLLEQATLGLVGTGEGTLHVPEELGLEQAVRQGGAVLGHEGAILAGSAAMDGPGHQLLARPGLPGHDDGELRIDDALELVEDRAHRVRGADDAGELLAPTLPAQLRPRDGQLPLTVTHLAPQLLVQPLHGQLRDLQSLVLVLERSTRRAFRIAIAA